MFLLKFKKILILSLIFLISCKKPPFMGEDIMRPKVNIKDSWYNKSFVTLDIEEDNKWWKKFKNSELNFLIELLLKNNYSLSEIHSRIRQSRIEAGLKKADFFPEISLSSSFTRSSDNFNPINPNNKNIYNFFRSGLNMSWEIDIFGSNYNEMKFKELTYLSIIEEKNYLIQSLISEVVIGFINVNYLKRDLELTQKKLKYYHEKSDLIEKRLNAGLENQIKINEIEEKILLTKIDISALNQKIYNEIHKIEFLCGKNSGDLKELILNSKIINHQDNFSFVIDFPLNIILNRPDVKSASYNYMSSIANKNFAIAQIFPKISLSSFLGFSNTKSGNLLKSNSRFFGNSVSFNVPIMDFGRSKNAVKIADEIKIQSSIILKEKINNALQEIEITMNDIVKYQDQKNLIQKKVKKAYESTQLNENRYQAGLISYLELIDNKIKLNESLMQKNNQNQLLDLSIISFYKSIGLWLNFIILWSIKLDKRLIQIYVYFFYLI